MTSDYNYYGIGEAPATFNEGDFVLTHQSAWTSRMIQIGQGIQFRGERRKFAYWNHAIWIASSEGDIIEAVGKGVSRNTMDEYINQEYVVIHTDLDPENIAQGTAFVEAMLHDGYGFVEIISIAFQLLTTLKVSLTYGDTIICSALVARGLEHGGEIFDLNPYMIKPANLAECYDITPPSTIKPSIRQIKKRFELDEV